MANAEFLPAATVASHGCHGLKSCRPCSSQSFLYCDGVHLFLSSPRSLGRPRSSEHVHCQIRPSPGCLYMRGLRRLLSSCDGAGCKPLRIELLCWLRQMQGFKPAKPQNPSFSSPSSGGLSRSKPLRSGSSPALVGSDAICACTIRRCYIRTSAVFTRRRFCRRHILVVTRAAVGAFLGRRWIRIIPSWAFGCNRFRLDVCNLLPQSNDVILQFRDWKASLQCIA